MKKLCILICLLAVPAALAQTTQVSVSKGLVRAETAAGQAMIEAGRKGVLAENSEPAVMVDDPMVEALLKMYEWVEAEKEAEKINIEYSSIQIHNFADDKRACGGAFSEMPNAGGEPTNLCRLGKTTLLDEAAFYDLQGNLLDYEVDRHTKNNGCYWIHFRQDVQPGERFKFFMIGIKDISPSEIRKEGPLYTLNYGNCTANCLNYFKVILPKSAVLVECSRDIMLTDIFEGRVAITIRNYTGENADGMYDISFLWPAKDESGFADVPGQYRGISGGNEGNDLLVAEYRAGMERINGGEKFFELSDPVKAFLSVQSAVARKDKRQLLDASYLQNEAAMLKVFENSLTEEMWARLAEQGRMRELLSTPPWPLDPNDGYLHPIYVCEPGTNKRSDMVVFVCKSGRWLLVGNAGNRQDTDPSVFAKYLNGGPKKSKLEALSWVDGGEEALEVYNEFVETGVNIIEDWRTLGTKLVGAGRWDEAIGSFRRCEELHSYGGGVSYFTAVVWEGHIYDVRGQRDEALKKYKQALEYADDMEMRHDQWGIVLNRQWVEERIREPFTKEMVGK